MIFEAEKPLSCGDENLVSPTQGATQRPVSHVKSNMSEKSACYVRRQGEEENKQHTEELLKFAVL